MARNFLTPINLNVNELQNFVVGRLLGTSIDNLSGANLVGGRLQFDTTANTLRVYNGSAWQTITTGTINTLTFNNSGSGAASGSTYNGGSTLTVSYNSLGAAPAANPTFTGTITTPLTTAGIVLTSGAGALSSTATIADSYLATISTAGKVLNSATTATNANTANAIVARDASGNFSAGTITANLTGNASGTAGSLANALTFSTGLTLDSGTTFTGAAARTVSLATVGIAGTYTKVTTDAYGRVSSATTLSSGDIPQLGNITNAGAIGSTSGWVVSTTTSGVLTASSALPNGTTATTQAAANNSTHVATTAYVDTAVFNGQAGFNVHAAVAAASTANISGTYTAGSSDQSQGTGIGATFAFSTVSIDGVTLVAGMRVLLKNQTTQTQNGVYTVNSPITGTVTLTRATDFDNSVAGEVFNGDLIYIGGTGGQAGTTWVMNSNGTATTPAGAVKIGTDNINWVQFAGAGTYTGTNGVSVAGTVVSGVNASTLAVGVASYLSTQFAVNGSAQVSITNLSAAIVTSGTLAAARGGTGADLSGSTQYGIPYFTSAGVMASTAAGASTQVLIGNASGAPTWTNISGLTVSAATSSTTVNVSESISGTYYLVMSPSTTTGQKALAQNSNANAISYVASTGALTATSFVGSGVTLTNLNASNVASGTLSGIVGVTAGSTSSSFVTYNGTTSTAGQFDGSATTPTGITRLNYNGYLYAAQLFPTTALTLGANNFNLNMSAAGQSLNFFNNSTTGDLNVASALTTGNLNIATGIAFTSGAVNIGTGAMTANTKAINIGTNGLTGSTTNITIGTNAGTPTTTINGTVKLGATAFATDGLVRTSSTNGTLSIATAGTHYVVSVAGTTNQITVSGSNGILTLSTPQNIHTAATPQFAGIGLGTTAPAAGITVSGGKITAAAGVTGYASLLIAAGSADPTSPVSGDVWNNAGVLKFRDASSVSQVVALAGSAGTTLNSTITFSSLTRVAPLSSGTAGYVKVDASGNLTSVAETYTRKYAENNGALTATSGAVTWTVTHNLNTSNVTAQIYQNSTNASVEVDVVTTSANVVTLTFNSATLTGSEYRVVVIG
jgi:hypothetical protein